MEEGIFLERSKIDLLGKYGKDGFTAMELYVYYLFQSLSQGSKIIKAPQEEARKGLDWGRDRFVKSRGILIKAKLIESIKEKDSNGRFSGSFIKIC